MSLTIMEVLENAKYNLDGKMPQIQIPLAKEQLANAITALENGWPLYEEFEERMLTEENPE